MERGAKLAAVLLGMCFTFSAFPCVSPTRVYNSELIIQHITELLTQLEGKLQHLANNSDFKVEGPRKAAWEGDINCTGSFLDIFTSGTQAISGKFSDNGVTRISKSISRCVKHLENTDCKELERYHGDRCGKEVNNQTAKHLVKAFLGFSEAFLEREICGESFRHKYDRRRDDWPPLHHIC